MKIIKVYNYKVVEKSDLLIKSNISKEEGLVLLEELNRSNTDHIYSNYLLVHDDYPLYRGKVNYENYKSR